MSDVATVAITGVPIHQGYTITGIPNFSDRHTVAPNINPQPTISGSIIVTFRDQYTDRFDDPNYYG